MLSSSACSEVNMLHQQKHQWLCGLGRSGLNRMCHEQCPVWSTSDRSHAMTENSESQPQPVPSSAPAPAQKSSIRLQTFRKIQHGYICPSRSRCFLIMHVISYLALKRAMRAYLGNSCYTIAWSLASTQCCSQEVNVWLPPEASDQVVMMLEVCKFCRLRGSKYGCYLRGCQWPGDCTISGELGRRDSISRNNGQMIWRVPLEQCHCAGASSFCCQIEPRRGGQNTSASWQVHTLFVIMICISHEHQALQLPNNVTAGTEQAWQTLGKSSCICTGQVVMPEDWIVPEVAVLWWFSSHQLQSQVALPSRNWTLPCAGGESCRQ